MVPYGDLPLWGSFLTVIVPHIENEATSDLFLIGCARVMVCHCTYPCKYVHLKSKSVQDTDRGYNPATHNLMVTDTPENKKTGEQISSPPSNTRKVFSKKNVYNLVLLTRNFVILK